MPLCGFNKKMIDGIALFSMGLFEATVKRGEDNGLTAIEAVQIEIDEIRLFVGQLRERYGTAVDTPKKMAEMIYGVAIFGGALFQATLADQGTADQRLRDSFDRQVEAISEFLERVEYKHQELRKSNTPIETMRKAVEWIDHNDKSVSPLPADMAAL